MQVIASLLIVFVLEATLLLLTWLLDEKSDQSLKKKGFYIILEVIVMGGAGYIFHPLLMILYNTKAVPAIISVIIFAIVSIFFDLPVWRISKANYELTDQGNFYKFCSQLAVIATAAGIAWWQNLPIQTIEASRMGAVALLIGYIAIVATLLALSMGLTFFLFNKGLLNVIYKKKESK